MRDPDWLRLFPDADYRWSMNLRPGDARDFFSGSRDAESILGQRRRQLAEDGGHYTVLPATAVDLIDVAIEQFGIWRGRPFSAAFDAAASLEPDWVLLRPDAEGTFRVEAGVVCFPSHWSLPDKVGMPLEAVHGPVPRLNEALGRQVGNFLAKLVPGTEWERENWGLSADAELDHHPRHRRPRLSGEETLQQIWIRLERQLLVRLSGGGILFGIHVSNHRLDAVVASWEGLSDRIARSLRTMPEESACYKGIADARVAIAQRLVTRDL
jgi:dimethylamine monooxygenase subunit A